MRAIERTTRAFVASLEAVPGITVDVSHSCTRYGRSSYVHIRDVAGRRYWKVRISDHAVGMRRATSGEEDLYLHAKDKPRRWAVWLGELVRQVAGGRVERELWR